MTDPIVTDFMDNGAKGTTSNLFTNAMSTMPGSSFMELYGALTPVLARQFVNVPDTPINPLTQAFMGEALEYGDVIEDIYIDPVMMGATKYRPDATDELGFADVGMRKQYSTINAMNTGKVSRYMRELRKASMDSTVAGALGDGIISALRVGQVSCLENQAAKVLVSSMPESCNVYCGVDDETDDAAAAILKEREKIVDVAITMAKVNGTYTATGYQAGAAKEVYVIAPREKWADLIMDSSGIYHPEFLMFGEFEKLGTKITPIAVDDIATPVTSEEVSEYTTLSGVVWDDAPGKDQPKPDYIICDKRYFKINPFIDRYEMFAKDVVSGVPYTNFFLHMQNAISYQPNRKAVRVYSGVAPE